MLLVLLAFPTKHKTVEILAAHSDKPRQIIEFHFANDCYLSKKKKNELYRCDKDVSIA